MVNKMEFKQDIYKKLTELAIQLESCEQDCSNCILSGLGKTKTDFCGDIVDLAGKLIEEMEE